MPYSVRCAPLRAIKTTRFTAASDRCGKSQCNNGARIREEWRNEPLSADAPKMTTIQTRIGSQYFKKDRYLDTAQKKQIRPAEANTNVIRFACDGRLWQRMTLLC